MVHLSYAIAQFFAILLGSVVRSVGGVIVAGATVLVAIAVLAALVRRMARRRR